MFSFHKSVFAAALTFLGVASVQAITYIVPTDRVLVNGAKAIVIGTAIESHAEMNASGGIVTVADFEIEQVLKGTVADGTIRIVEAGGFLSERSTFVPGSPRYAQGKRYLVLLDQWKDGAWRTEGFQLGQFEFTTDLEGRDYVSRGGDEAIYGLDARDGSPYTDNFRKADEFVSFIRSLAAAPNAPARDGYFVPRSEVIPSNSFQPQSKLTIAPNFSRASYLLSGNYRWQSGPGASWDYCCPGNYPSVFNGPSAAGSAVTAWNGNGSIAYVMGGENATAKNALQSPDGLNTVMFNDPNNLIGGSGAFAVGGITAVSGSYMLSDGATYNNTVEVDVVVTQNSKIPGFITQQLAVSLLTHEVGHTLGFRHADGTGSNTSPPPACDPSTSDCASSNCGGAAPFAVMAHCISAPGLSLQSWDHNAAQTVYGSGPVCTPPSVTSATASPTNIAAGQSSTLSVSAGGTSPFTYQWYQGSPGTTTTPLGTTASIIVSPSATTTYWVQVTGQCAPAASSGAVTVNVACTPVITAQPQNQQVTSGGTATLSVSFTSATPVTVTWYQGFVGDTSHSVGTGASITSPVITTATSFWAQLVNSCGSTNSNSATISIASTCTAPSGATASASATSINAGQPVTLQVVVSGTSPLSYQWYRGTAPDTSNPISGATSFTVTDTPSANATYWVKVSNACGNTASNTVSVTVIGAPTCTAPSITTQPASQTIVIGTKATLTVAASGTNIHYSWFQGSLGDTSKPVGSDSASYTTPALTIATPYWVHVQGDCGAVNSTTATISVRSGRQHAVRHR